MTQRLVIALLFLAYYGCFSPDGAPASAEVPLVMDGRIVSYRTTPSPRLHMYARDETGRPFSNIGTLGEYLALRQDTIVLAINGGMFLKDLSPQGLYIEDGEVLSPLDTVREAYGNFYLQPNGVFYLTEDHKAGIQRTSDYSVSPPARVNYATQSGPMLLIDGALHPAFNEGSPNLHIRNGVGLLPNGDLLFAISTERVNFFDFATFFKNAGCENALYLDGYVSKMYGPEIGINQQNGKYGIIIAELK